MKRGSSFAGVVLAGSVLVGSAMASPSGDRLIAAVQDGLVPQVDKLIAAHADINATDSAGATALAWAVMRNDGALVARLLKAHANPNPVDANGVTPLMLAIDSNAPALAQALLAGGADPRLARPGGETPLMTAVRVGSPDIVQMLLARKVDVNAHETAFDQTALMWATGNPELVRLLLAAGANIHAATKSWETLSTNYSAAVSTLGNTGIPWNYDGEYTGASGGQTPLMFAAQKADLDSVKMLVDAGADVNTPAADGATALLSSLYNFAPNRSTTERNQRGFFGGLRYASSLKVASYLLDHGAKPNVADRAGYTPLHGAVLSMLKFSRLGGVIIGMEKPRKNAKAAPKAQAAAAKDNAKAPAEALAVVQKLLDAGANPNAATSNTTPGPLGAVKINPAPPGSTPYHLAGAAHSAALIEMMAAHGANANQLRRDGLTPFAVAVQSNDLPVVQAMAAHGADLKMIYNPSDKIADPVKSIAEERHGETIAHIAAIAGSDAVVPWLAAQGVPMDVKNDHGETALDLADAQERFRYARALEAAGNLDKTGAGIVRETKTSDAFKQAMGIKAKIASDP